MAENVTPILYKKTAEDLGQPLNVVETTMGWVFKDVVKSMKIYNRVELSGWGTFIISPAKIRKRLVNFYRMRSRLEAKEPTENVLIKLESVNKSITYFEAKLAEYESTEIRVQENSGGVEELHNSPGEAEGGNSEGGNEQAGDMQELSK